MSESDNLPTGGNETAQTSITLDEAANLDFLEPDEDNQDGEGEQQAEGDTDEANEGQEAEDVSTSEDDDQDGAETGETAEAEPGQGPGDDVIVVVDGEQKTLAELKAGYFRQSDYSRKTLEIAETRKGLEAMSARVSQSVDVIADFLMKQIPPAPDPQLAMTDPGRFVQQKALHEASVQQVNALLAQAGEVKGVASTLTAEQKKELIGSEEAKLREAFPATATPDGRKKFFETAATAAKELGYSDDEIKLATDHRLFALSHYAAIGMRAEKAREKAAQKVQNAPPVAPQRQRPHGANQASARKNQEAMKRLARTGSIDDAIAIDWD